MVDRGELFAPAGNSAGQLSLAAAKKTSSVPPDHQALRSGLGKVLSNNPAFSFRSSSLSAVTDNESSFTGIPEATRPEVGEALRDLHRAQALAHIPEALPVLFQTKMSAFRVSQQPQDQFVAKFGPHVGGAAAAERIHDHAVRVVARNDHVLTVALQAARGSGLAAIDGLQGPKRPSKGPEQINLEKLFGSLDYCECSDCSSVTSPAAYYVELLQFLRNNNLNPSYPWTPSTDSPSYDWSPLDYLFRRRPDLACLELTCANSNTVLPYIDLANEVMESFIVHQKRFVDSVLVPKQSWIDIFNASDAAEGRGGSSAELLAVPQNVNQAAYEILDDAVYPAAKLPYNQPLDTIRQFLIFLTTTRAEVMRSFQAVYRPPLKTSIDDWAELHQEAVARAIAAEELGITQEEYIILTKEAFWPKAHFDLRYGQEVSSKVYRERIGVKNPWEYWGLDYTSVDDMLDMDEDRQSGLAFVKRQLLPRTGVQYSDLVDAVKTRFMNPNMPQGRAKNFLTSNGQDTDDPPVRLRRLNGKSATKHDYDKLHRFLRLWRKLGWTIGETDAAISAFGSTTPAQPQDPEQGIAALKKLADLTSLTILQLLSWWTNIDTFGPDSLYAKLFLTHNILGLDPVFAPDQDGNYLVQNPPPKISEHRAVLFAVFQLRPAELDALIALAAVSDDTLNLENVTKIYRYSLFAKVLGVRPGDLGIALAAFDPMSPWYSAQSAVDFVEVWNQASTAGFEFKQLAYVFKNKDEDPLRPVGPTTITADRLASSLYTDLKAIDAKYAVASSLEDATDKAVESSAQVLFSGQAVADILGFLNGTHIYTTNAPQIDGLVVPDALKAKLKYGDEPSTDPADPSKGTAAAKRLYFLTSFIPFLKKKLSVETAVTAMAGASSLQNDITATLLEDFIIVDKFSDGGRPAVRGLDAVLAIKDDQVSSSGWRGRLLVSNTQRYTFLANSVHDSDAPSAILIDGQEYAFTKQQEDPTDVWIGEPIKLFGGRLYELVVRDQQAASLMWMTDSSEPTLVPSSSLIPSHASSGIKAVLSLLVKSSFIINNFNFGLDEVRHFGQNGIDFAEFDWNRITLASWRRLNDYVTLRNSLPKAAKPLIQLFKWALSSSPAPKLDDVPDQIHQVTLWELSDISQLIAPSAFDIANKIAAFFDEIALTKMQKSLLVAHRIGISITNLFKWGRPLVRYSDALAMAESIKTVTRSRYSLSDWERAIKPTFDTLRQHQSDALSGYLVVQPTLVNQGIIDVDSLFEFFLIDPSMCPCMETSRLKQATSSVQLFIQRCLLGLEDQGAGFGRGVDIDMLDRHRWEWMQRYRLWEANRKVFLFPENWIQPSLRDDKTPQYKAFESELLQGDLTEQTAVDAVKNYLFSLEGIANLQVFSVYPQQKVPKPTSPGPGDLDELAMVHFFARTPASPYRYFYRTLDCVYMTWTPWQQMQVDISSYEIERSGSDANSSRNGCYIVPFMHDGRLVLGLPQFMKKQLPQPVPAQSFEAMATGDTAKPASESLPLEYWEIKFGFSELRNGIWKQKIVSTDAIWEAAVPSIFLPGLHEYQFVPQLAAPSTGTVPLDTITHIHILRGEKNKIGKFSFDGRRVYGNGAASVQGPGGSTFFQLENGTATPFPIYSGGSAPTYDYPAVSYSSTGTEVGEIAYSGFREEPFGHRFAHALVGSVTSSTNLDAFFQRVQTVPSSSEDLTAEAWGAPKYVGNSLPERDTYNELFRPYSTYNWEMGFHVPMALATKFLEMQQFDLALKMCHYVFDPYAKGSGVSRYWKFPPFKTVDSTKTLQKLFQSLKPGEPVSTANQINQWRDRPFEPHVLARLRPVAYMRWTVVTYIQILIAYGDWYFNQNTLELIPMAIQCYVLASHIYGPRGQKIPRRGKKHPETYLTLLNKWDAFGNAMVQLELDFPFSNQIGHQWGESNGVKGLANIFGFATNLYFCIPNNDQLTSVRDTINDRLYKIRHCQDIKGVFRRLPLYEPPLDVGNLVAAAAQGLSLTEVLNDLNTTMPNYRFSWVLPKALELIAELKSLGGAFLSAKEKQDGEALSVLRQKHDVSMQNLVLEQKKLALVEAEANLASLVQSRKRPQYQLEHTLKLLGEDGSVVPQGLEDEWRALGDPIPAPQSESGLKLSPEEAEEMGKTRDASMLSTAVSVIQTISSELQALPTMNAHASPFGVGVAACWGPPNIAEAMNGMASVMRLAADVMNHQASMASRKNSHIRTRQERIQNANTQGLEIKNIDAQIATQRVRVSIAQQEITNQQSQIDHAEEVLTFLASKYTNTELYSFLEGRVRTLYYQLYQLAYAYARKSELVYHFERGDSNTQFINSGFWIPSRSGLLSGETLYLALKQLEAAYHETTGWDYEVSKFVSLRQTNPLSLLQLRETGKTVFALPEILFDMDFPGHYNRKIRSVSLTIPCVVGPYTTINATLRLTSHKIRADATATSARDYVEKVDDGAGADRRFKTTSIPHSAVAVSNGNSDSGIFDMNFTGERFMPFEGAGVISSWSLELPSGFRQFDYSSISDVVLHIKYTSREGGGRLKEAATGAVAEYVKRVEEIGSDGSGAGLWAFFDIKAEFGIEWQAFTHPGTGKTERVLSLKGLNERLPVYTKGRPPSALVTQDIWIAMDGNVRPGDIVLEQGGNVLDFEGYGMGGGGGDGMTWAVAHRQCALSDWRVTVRDVVEKVGRMWVVVRYVMK
ncbi:hypothetical protein B0T16DRAFT_380998 [Cercophora newfieldiana]|uniref:Uncharacterized protein n=1 Tax=Cercophora newfieldiana TaxID=92897 RepID=A0AA39XX77_9PEZI|nr:hypothetical protein B0T16DRAFT_380998 [Cercophora newfieldiana]